MHRVCFSEAADKILLLAHSCTLVKTRGHGKNNSG